MKVEGRIPPGSARDWSEPMRWPDLMPNLFKEVSCNASDLFECRMRSPAGVIRTLILSRVHPSAGLTRLEIHHSEYLAGNLTLEEEGAATKVLLQLQFLKPWPGAFLKQIQMGWAGLVGHDSSPIDEDSLS